MLPVHNRDFAEIKLFCDQIRRIAVQKCVVLSEVDSRLELARVQVMVEFLLILSRPDRRFLETRLYLDLVEVYPIYNAGFALLTENIKHSY